jgi:broad specificity phosphatase PhoE
MKTIYLIRHGEQTNIELYDPPLTPAGIAQSKKLAKRLSTLPIKKIYVSTLKRALQTYKEYKKLKPKIPTTKTEDLKEIYRTLVGGPPKEGTPKEREMKDRERIERFWKNLLNDPQEEIVVFCHGNVIRYILSKVLKSDPKETWVHLPISHCSISKITINKNIKIRKINDTSHYSGNN